MKGSLVANDTFLVPVISLVTFGIVVRNFPALAIAQSSVHDDVNHDSPAQVIARGQSLFMDVGLAVSATLLHSRHEMSTSTRKADTTRQVLKTRVRPQRIESRPQQDSWVESFFVASFEPTHGLIRVPKRGVDHGNLRSMRIA